MIVNGDAGVDSRVLRHQITDLQQDVAGVPAGRGRWRRKTMMEGDQEGILGRNFLLRSLAAQRQNSQFQAHAPDVDGEATVAAHGVLVGTLQGDGGFGSSAHFTAEHHGLAKCTRHVRQGVEELRSHCSHGKYNTDRSNITYFKKISPVYQLRG